MRRRSTARPAVTSPTSDRSAHASADGGVANELADSLRAHLASWARQAAPVHPRLVVLGPYLGADAVLTHVASALDWRLLEAPETETICGAGDAWRGRVTEIGTQPLVVPALHRTFLRHVGGLDRARELVGFLRAREGHTLVGCESWAWRYLRAALRLDAVFGEPTTLQACDADRLGELLPDGGGALADSLAEVAAESGGNPAVAAAIARLVGASSRSASSITTPAAASDAWWHRQLPSWPASAGRLEAFVARSLLIHGGLTAGALAMTMLSTAEELHAALECLAAARLAAVHDRVWAVTPEGYPAVRAYLASHGYPTDDL